MKESIKTVWKILDKNGNKAADSKTWSKKTFLDRYLCKFHQFVHYGRSSDEKKLNSAYKEVMENLADCHVVEAEIIERIVSSTPIKEYAEPLFEQKMNKVKADQQAKLKKELEEKKKKKKKRKKLYEKLKKEFEN